MPSKYCTYHETSFLEESEVKVKRFFFGYFKVKVNDKERK